MLFEQNLTSVSYSSAQIKCLWNQNYRTNLSYYKTYGTEFTPTESSAGDIFLYISSHLSYEPCPNPNVYKACQLQYTFVDVINLKIVILSLLVFTDIQIWLFLILRITILANFFKFYPNNKNRVFLLGDFNINLLNYNDHQPTNDFLDSLASNSFIPYVLHPTRITSHSKSLTDNILSNFISHKIKSGNITATISDNLPKFSFVSNILSNHSTQKSMF